MSERRESAIKALENMPTTGSHPKRGDMVLNPLYKKHQCPGRHSDFRDIEVVFVRLELVTSNQKYLFRNDLALHINRKKTMRERLPLVYCSDNGIYFVTNGNHRIVSNIMKRHVRMRMRVRWNLKSKTKWKIT